MRRTTGNGDDDDDDCKGGEKQGVTTVATQWKIGSETYEIIIKPLELVAFSGLFFLRDALHESLVSRRRVFFVVALG